LELAAARVRMLSVDQIAARLDDCLGLLTSGLRTDELRHQTMRASLDWSYDLLPPSEQAALRRLSIFPDSFELGAALAVLATDEPAGIETVSRLMDKSLVVVHSEGDEVRYRLLEPVRQYAGEKLAGAGETKSARDRLCAFLLSLTDTWIGSILSAQKLRRVAADQENFRAALAWSWSDGNFEAALRLVAAMSASWTWRGDPQGGEWMELVLAEPEPRDHRARVQVLSNFPLMLYDLGDFERAHALMKDAAEMARRLNDFEAMAKVDISFGELELARGNTANARLCFERGLSMYESLGYAEGAGWTHHDLGWLAIAEHDPDRARSHFERAGDLAQTFDGGEWLRTHARLALAPLTVAAGEQEQGVCLAENALRDARSLPDDAVLLMALTRTAETSVLVADYARAGELVGELLELLHDLGTRRWVAGALELSALVLESRGDQIAAAEILGASDVLREVSGSAADQGVDRCRERLTAALGRDLFADRLGNGGKLSPERAVAEARAALEFRA
jgi:tetratricopeptide (TPR) repeat protein